MKKGILRLKDVNNISSKDVDYSIIMREVLGFNNNWIGRKLVFAKKFSQAYALVKQGKLIDPKLQKYDDDCEIKKPIHIDNISFKAMMELQATFNNGSEKSVQEMMIDIISIVCYSSNHEGDYISHSPQFELFRQRVGNSPMIQMFGLYNWIDESLIQSNRSWEKKFLSVKVEDKDYELAGGHRMAQFNIINTIKSMCADYNCSYDEAWQMSYALTQVNSYEKASSSYTQDQMRQIKEIKMKKERATNQYH